MTDQPTDSASIDLPTLPRCLLISEPGSGHLYIGHTGDFCWRVCASDTGPIRRAIADALAHHAAQHHVTELGYWTNSLDMPKLPPNLVIWEDGNGTLCLVPLGDDPYTIERDESAAIRRTIAAALKARADHPRPDYPEQPPTAAMVT